MNWVFGPTQPNPDMVNQIQQNSTNAGISWVFARPYLNSGFGELNTTELKQPREELGVCPELT
jgi:hypothetical protein